MSMSELVCLYVRIILLLPLPTYIHARVDGNYLCDSPPNFMTQKCYIPLFQNCEYIQLLEL